MLNYINFSLSNNYNALYGYLHTYIYIYTYLTSINIIPTLSFIITTQIGVVVLAINYHRNNTKYSHYQEKYFLI